MSSDQSRHQHKSQVVSFLQNHFSSSNWEINLPRSTGTETYFARSGEHAFFIKLGAPTERYQLMSALGLSPPVIKSGFLDDGSPILIQHQIAGRKPTRSDFHRHLSKFARVLQKTHQSRELKHLLPKATSDLYKDLGLETLEKVRHRWGKYKAQVPSAAEFVDLSIEELTKQIFGFTGHGSVASHNDVCNANWLVTNDGNVYLIDLESMSQDDPASDIGALLWWYYPPEMRGKFFDIVGYKNDGNFQERMRIRMALHCLNIILPRDNSFDKFDPVSFDKSLEDFLAVIKGEENPKGYLD